MADIDKTKLNEIERCIDAVTSSERSLNETYKQFYRLVDGFPTLKKVTDSLETAMLEDRKVAQNCVRRFQKCSENLGAGKKLADVDRELASAKAECRRDTERELDSLRSTVKKLRDELRQLDTDCERLLDLTKRDFDVRLDAMR